MKVSINLAQEFSNVDLKSIPRDELLQRVGAQLGAVEEVIDWAPKYEGIIIVKVITCASHPDADKLSVCTIDDGGITPDVNRGENNLIQVVCGAPNVYAGMFAVWLPPGTIVPNTLNTDPFVLEAREIRGVVSNGMLASAKELVISDDHEGVVELNRKEVGFEPKIGEPLTNYFGMDDFIIDCENKMFTHRPDCFGNLGVARELAGINGLAFKSPDWYIKPHFEDFQDQVLEILVENKIPDLVPRFMAVVMKNIEVKKSPVWLQALLTRVGIKPINNVVDVTNYIMHLTAQPLHAFDYDKLKVYSNEPSLMPRMSKKGEKLKLLGQKEIELTGEEIVIATDKQAIALAGVMGGADTEVDENTNNIVIECASFDMYSVRRTSMRYGLFTDAVTRFNKSQSPLQNNVVLAFAMKKMHEFAGAEQASDVADIHGDLKSPVALVVGVDFINARLGSNLSADEMSQLLNNVEIETHTKDNNIHIVAPFWRMDIILPEDIVEEVGRLYGYDKLPVKLPKRTIKPAKKSELLEFKHNMRQRLAAVGANEVITYSFIHGDLLKKTGIDPDRWAYHVRNAISPDLQYYRPSLMPSLLAKVHANIKSQAGSDDNRFAIFEIGKAHVKGHEDAEKLPEQMDRLALVVTADDKTAKRYHFGASYYLARKYLQVITKSQDEITILEDDSYSVTAPFQKGRSSIIAVNGVLLGVIGEFRPEVRSALKLPEYSAGFEIDLNLLQKQLRAQIYQPLNPYPKSQQDLTLEVETSVLWDAVQKELFKTLAFIKNEQGYNFEIVPKDIFSRAESEKKRLTFRIGLSHPEKTLKTEEVNKLIERLAEVAGKQFNALRI
ncbi:phenylalanine--tRNA ligase subunit beta [Candidatus Saccharibacteria bacterium]|nr:phenylalanine--tRNA ligase subunit beta [Candidatus Saccharibacteria bacterium]